MPDLDAALAHLTQVVAVKMDAAQQASAYLPRCDAQYRIIPNPVVRSAVFPALNRQERRMLKDEKLWSSPGLSIYFTGYQLDQSDFSLFLTLISQMDTNARTSCTKYSILKTLGRCTGQSDHDWLDRSIDRLLSATVRIETDEKSKKRGYQFKGHLLNSVGKDKATGQMRFNLDPDFCLLFLKAGYTLINVEQRESLTSPTAQALHAWLSSHRPPWSYSLDTLASVAGITGVNRRATIRRALDQLVGIGHVSAWTEDAGVVTIVCGYVDNGTG